MTIKSLYYITHLDNLASILEKGILSHQEVASSQIQYKSIYNVEIVERRRKRLTPSGRSLWEYANVYFQPRNPMLYKVVNEVGKQNVVVLGLKATLLEHPDALISLGNAAVSESSILVAKEGLPILKREYLKILQSDWWTMEDGSKRKIMAECLIPDRIAPSQIHTIYVADQVTARAVKEIIGQKSTRVEVAVEPHMFFQPRREGKISHHIFWIDGDLFFSQMQTLTISVNTKGIMGKGLASRAKYQFPDVYVIYQDVCRNKILKIGKPYLYRREASLDAQLAEEPYTLSNSNAVKWFLLFPTKEDWRKNSQLSYVQAGMQWLLENYQKEGILSIALPALGCGLGGLAWKDVGPLMVSYLTQMDIQAAIYLPQEVRVPNELLTPQFLLGKR